MTVWRILDDLERRMLDAERRMPHRRPWVDRDRRALLQTVRQCLGIRESWIPGVKLLDTTVSRHAGVQVERLQAQTWPGCHALAHLYRPYRPASTPWPLVILCCGHGLGGKLATGYQRMAWRIARAGAAVLVPDNIGQGEREPMGHRNVSGVFRCGLSLQGLIVMETMGWLRWARRDPRFDPQRIGAIGNSGGGTLTLFLGALCRDELAVVSSSGYPCTFGFVAQKEKHLCGCNILPGVVGQLDMWQLYGCVAPKPLFLFQGRSDNLFPVDLFVRVSRKVAHCYRRRDADAAFQSEIFEGAHSWDDARGEAMTAYLARTLGLPRRDIDLNAFQDAPGKCLDHWPAKAATAEQIAAHLTGIALRPGEDLCDVFQPELPESMNPQLARTDFRQLAAQQTAFLPPGERPVYGAACEACPPQKKQVDG